MAKAKKFTPAPDLLALIESTKPQTPIMSSAEKTYFKSLKKRGFSEEQIKKFIEKAGYSITSDFFVIKTKKTATSAPSFLRSKIGV